MRDDLAWMTLRAGLLHRQDRHGRLLTINEPGGGGIAPRFYLGRSGGGAVWRFRADLPEELVDALAALCAREPVMDDLQTAPHHLSRYLELLGATVYRAGPAYQFTHIAPPVRAACAVTQENESLLDGGFDAFKDELSTLAAILCHRGKWARSVGVPQCAHLIGTRMKPGSKLWRPIAAGASALPWWPPGHLLSGRQAWNPRTALHGTTPRRRRWRRSLDCAWLARISYFLISMDMEISATDIDITRKQLAATPRRIAKMSRSVENARLYTVTEEEDWSARDILAHLRACADVWGRSMVIMIQQDHPTLRYVSPRTWIRKTDYLEQEFQQALRAFSKQRAELLSVLTPLDAAGWARPATFTGTTRGRAQTVMSYARRLADHEREHLEQLAVLLKD